MLKPVHVVRFPLELYNRVQALSDATSAPCSSHIFIAVSEYLKKHAPKPDAAPTPAPKPKPKSSDWTIKEIQDSYQKDFAAQAKQATPQGFYDDPNDIPDDYIYADENDTPS